MPRAARLRRLGPGQLRRGGLLRAASCSRSPAAAATFASFLLRPVCDVDITPRRMRAGNRAGKRRRMRRAAGNLLVAHRGDVPALRPLVQHGHGVALG